MEGLGERRVIRRDHRLRASDAVGAARAGPRAPWWPELNALRAVRSLQGLDQRETALDQAAGADGGAIVTRSARRSGKDVAASVRMNQLERSIGLM